MDPASKLRIGTSGYSFPDWVGPFYPPGTRRLIVILDRWNVHRKAVRVLQEHGANWLQPEWLPPYAPDLNPAEQVWNHVKYADLANFIPDDLADLDHAVRSSMARQRDQTSLIRSYFHLAGLEL